MDLSGIKSKFARINFDFNTRFPADAHFFAKAFPTCAINFPAYANRFPTYAILFPDYANGFLTYANHLPSYEIGYHVTGIEFQFD